MLLLSLLLELTGGNRRTGDDETPPRPVTRPVDAAQCAVEDTSIDGPEFALLTDQSRIFCKPLVSVPLRPRCKLPRDLD